MLLAEKSKSLLREKMRSSSKYKSNLMGYSWSVHVMGMRNDDNANISWKDYYHMCKND